MSLRVVSIALISALLAGVLVQLSSVSAAPTEKNKNTEPADVICDDPIIGTGTVLTLGNGVPAFLPNGRVVVAKRDVGEATFTVTTFDSVVSVGPFVDSFEAGANGGGFDDRLVECSFTGTFADTFTLRPRDAAFLGIPTEYVGTEVTAEGTAVGTAWVTIPGN